MVKSGCCTEPGHKSCFNNYRIKDKYMNSKIYFKPIPQLYGDYVVHSSLVMVARLLVL